jgi:glycerol-3-phosphate dehydrogenase
MSSQVDLSVHARRRHLKTLAGELFDVVVVGGGITGAGIARDAALRGLRVALIERRDFAAGTSSRSSKLIHGGLRYLQQGDVGLVREAAGERYVVRRLAPHLAQPVRMLFPLVNRREYAKLSVGLWTFDRLASVAEGERHRLVTAEEALEVEPRLSREELYGAAQYYEYVTDDARLVIEVVKSAVALGAVVANHLEVTRFLTVDDKVVGVEARSEDDDEEVAIRGRVVVNATGPWVDRVRLLSEPDSPARLRLTKGVHVGVPTERIGLSGIVVMNARDRRGVFAIPHGPVTYLGTTDTEYPEIADYPNVTWEDVEYLFDAANRTFDLATPLGPEDLVNAWAGLRPLLHQEGKKPTELSRQDEVMVNDAGLISIAGGKLTTFRRMAERVTDMVCARLVEGGQTLPPPVALSDQDPLSGGETGTDLARFEDYLASRVRDVKREGVERLVRLYGSNATSIVDAMERDPNHARQYSHDCLLTPAEVEYNLKYEMALTLQDVLERRTRLLLWDLQCGMSVAERVSTTLAESLGWDEARRQREVAEYQRLVDWLKTPTGAKEAAEEPQAMHG